MVPIETVEADVIPAMVRRIVEDFHPLKVILFGSYARGEAGRHSDVDLLVVLPEVTSRRAITVAIRDTLADFPVCKDVIVTTPLEVATRGESTGTVLRPALREGKVLYELDRFDSHFLAMAFLWRCHFPNHSSAVCHHLLRRWP